LTGRGENHQKRERAGREYAPRSSEAMLRHYNFIEKL